MIGYRTCFWENDDLPQSMARSSHEKKPSFFDAYHNDR